MFKQILDKGKYLVLLNGDPKKLESFFDTFSPKGVYLTAKLDKEQDAKDLLKKVEEWSLRGICIEM